MRKFFVKKKGIIILAVILTMSLLLCGCSEDEPAAEDNEVEVEAVENVPAIKGSQAYDIIISLEETGIPKADAMETTDGFSFSSTTASYSYYIETNSKHEVMCAKFMVLDGNDDGYLGFCGSMPYDKADSNAQQWVNDNIGTDATETFGDAIYTLSVGDQGPILTIKAVGYDEYVMELIS